MILSCFLDRHHAWLGAFFARWLLLTFAWCFVHYVADWLAVLPKTDVMMQLIAHFTGPLYRPYALWFADYYWLAFTLAGPLYFYEHRQRFTLANDKYQALIAFLCLGWLKRWLRITVSWSPLVRLGLLTAGLKLFFLPYMVSWGFQHGQQLWLTLQAFPADFRAWTRLLIQLCLLVDMALFTLGYLLESNRLGSDIRSVDPHLTGWLVCLCCYPPFNAFVFVPFDVAWFPIQLAISEPLRSVFNGLEVLCWIVFAWASVALGFKASNLTARGTVSHGPYRWLRHPAYTAKLAVWWIQGVIFGEFTVGILLAFTAVYVARALTEERHLLQVDADYAVYCHKVHRRFIPGLI